MPKLRASSVVAALLAVCVCADQQPLTPGDGPGCDKLTRQIAKHFCGDERGVDCLRCLQPHAHIFSEASCSKKDIQRFCYYGDDRGGDGIHGDKIDQNKLEEDEDDDGHKSDDDEKSNHRDDDGNNSRNRSPVGSPTAVPTLVAADDDRAATHIDDDDLPISGRTSTPAGTTHRQPVLTSKPRIAHASHVLETVPHKCWQGLYNLCHESGGLSCQNCVGNNWPTLSGQYFCSLDDIDKYCNGVDDDEGVRTESKEIEAQTQKQKANLRLVDTRSKDHKLDCEVTFQKMKCDSMSGIMCEHCAGRHLNALFYAGCNFHEINHYCNPDAGRTETSNVDAKSLPSSESCDGNLKRVCGAVKKGMECDNCAGANWPELVSHGHCGMRDVDNFCQRRNENFVEHPATTVDTTKSCDQNLEMLCKGETGMHCDECAGRVWPMLFKLGCRMSVVDTFCIHGFSTKELGNKCQADLNNLCSGDKGLSCDSCARSSWPTLAKAGCKMSDVDTFCVHEGTEAPTNMRMTGVCEQDLHTLCAHTDGLHCDDCAGKHWHYLTRIGCNFHELNRFCAGGKSGGGDAKEPDNLFPKSYSCHQRLEAKCRGKQGLHCDDCAGANWPALSSGGKCTMHDVDLFCNHIGHRNKHTDSDISTKHTCYQNLQEVCGGETGLHCDNCAGAHWGAMFRAGCKLEDVDSFCNHLD